MNPFGNAAPYYKIDLLLGIVYNVGKAQLFINMSAICCL